MKDMKSRIKAYFSNHVRELPTTFSDMWGTKIASLMTVLVIGIALALPSIFLMLFTNTKALAETLEGSPQISVFLKTTVTEEQRNNLEKTFKTDTKISKIQYISKEDALKELSTTLNAEEALKILPENPLPEVFVLHLKSLSLTEPELQGLIQSLRALSEVDSVQLDLDWVKRLEAFLKVAERLVTGLTTVLSLAVLLVIGNTLGLHIENKKNTIEVLKLVGATDSFVRRPFLYLGFWYGILGAVTGLFIVVLLMGWINSSASELLSLYQSSLNLEGLDIRNASLLLILGALLGVGAAWLSVGRHLRSLRPS